ncbi:MAG TPA: Crp/Fnr family transcriptional regulator [Actinomycetota bacterium]|jgi:CRP/FNR family cyclic AMP-dependent transcriptional regulator
MAVATSSLGDLPRMMAATPLLGSASPPSVRRLVEAGTMRRYRRSTYLFQQGDPSPEVLFLIEGRIEVASLSSGGQRMLHTTLDEPQFFGELGVLGGIPRTAAALALDESSVWAAPGEAFVEFLASESSAAAAMLRALARQVVAHEAFVDDLLFLDLKGRVAKRLLQLVAPTLDRLPEDGVPVPSIVTHADLASLSGGSRENVTRILSEMQRRGLIERDGRRFVLRRIGGLAKLAGLPPPF